MLVKEADKQISNTARLVFPNIFPTISKMVRLVCFSLNYSPNFKAVKLLSILARTRADWIPRRGRAIWSKSYPGRSNNMFLLIR